VFFVAGGVAWVGYWLLAYGLSQVRGCNAGFFKMGFSFSTPPPCSPDTGGGGGGSNVVTVPTKSPLSTTSFKTLAECQAYAAAHEPGSCAKNANGTYYFRQTATGH
jgi:hypothetical protein